MNHTRIYSIEPKSSPDQLHLVEASSKASALRYVAEQIYAVRVADQKTLVSAIQEGVAVERAFEEATAE
jgi:hypothetical protein